MDKNLIIEFLLRSQELDRLLDLPLIPLFSGRSTCLRLRENAEIVHVLLSKSDETVFAQFDPTAVALSRLPSQIGKLLVKSRTRFNIKPLDVAQVTAYVRTARSKFAPTDRQTGTWPWTQTRDWLALFWTWIADCDFGEDLFLALKSMPLLPTTMGNLRSPEQHVFFYPTDMATERREALANVGIRFVDPAIQIGRAHV